MQSARAVRALGVAAALVLGAADRVSLPFDFGWRWYLGEVSARSCLPGDFTTNLSAVQCSGLSAVPGATTAAACAQAACAAGAAVWQLCRPGSSCSAPCFVGGATACGTPSDRFIGAGRPPPPAPWDPAPANATYDDRAWDVVDAPHDALISTPYDERANNGQASIPKNVTWYRKHFVLPAAWRGQHVSVYVEGAFASTRAWLNGVELANHSHGYTSFALRLDNATGVVWGGANVLALFIDATIWTGWWYEGGGLYRPTHLVATAPVRVRDDSAWASAFLTGAVRARGPTPAAGLTADGAIVTARATVENTGTASAAVVRVAFALVAADGVTVVAAAASPAVNVSALGGAIEVETELTVADAELWSIGRPYLHTLVATVVVADGGAALDAVNVTTGLRSVRWDAEGGLSLNGQPVRVRGFCNHNNAAAVGMAVPTRFNLLRMQQLRGMGASSWRMAHNPGAPDTYALADRLGVTVLDENRVGSEAAPPPLGGRAGGGPAAAGGDDAATNLGDLIRRDRHHASVTFWSFCNEGACVPSTEPTLTFKVVADAVDGTRAVTANMFAAQVAASANATDLLDVQGFSHQSAADFAAFHARFPAKPVLATECCGCKSQRGEDADLPRNASVAYYNELGLPDPNCTQHDQLQAAYAPQWSGGFYVWTASDYFGEPNGWPHVSASHGQFDIGGVAKAPSYWYRAQFLAAVPVSDAARPPVVGPGADAVVHVVESWRGSASGARVIHVYTSCPYARLLLNGAPLDGGAAVPVPPFGWAVFSVRFAPGRLTAQGLAADGATVVAEHARASWGAPAALVLTVDAPSPATGTGAALYLDGSDVALLRATVVDAAGVPVADSAANVTFAVTDGPGLVVGCGNGDPASHEPNTTPWRSAYHGVVRAVVRTTVDAATPPDARALRRTVDVDAGAGPRSSSVLPVGVPAPTTMTVTASAPGLAPATLTLPLSVDPADAPLAAAAAAVGAAALQ